MNCRHSQRMSIKTMSSSLKLCLVLLLLLPSHLFAHIEVDRNSAQPQHSWQGSRAQRLNPMQTMGVMLDHMRTSRSMAEMRLRGGNGGKPGGSIHTNTIYLTGLPAYANEEWVAAFVGKKSVKKDSKTGKLQIFMYRDKKGVATGACLVGIEGISEAERICKELDGKKIEGVERLLCIRAKVVPRRFDKEEKLPEGWKRFTDQESGRDYFYNSVTGKTQWEVPENAFISSTDSGVKIGSAAGLQDADQYATSVGPDPNKDMEQDDQDATAKPKLRSIRGIDSPGTQVVPGGFISSSGTFMKNLPRGSAEDMKMYDRKAHERAAHKGPFYGDPGFIHCEGVSGDVVASVSTIVLVSAHVQDCYPGTCWPMHPEIARLRKLGIERTEYIYNSLQPPPGYIAGVGRGAVGTTTVQDEGPSFDAYEYALRSFDRANRLRKAQRKTPQGAPSGQGESSIVPGQFDDAAEKGRDLIGELLDEVGDDGGERDGEM
ncbi:hypothetical protein GUITHDRAFT_121547 [Guillardia theta CCMP2712]|uniref:WW domain-containing protein n=1 Tax=Guillardia theta (strain CCMP2712) TaxID=905079 RepID=L1I8Y5_GUITC|nr:hypothetical protein GUITHDRAFT_121547 [Guillardia theta CCMP2712]EKX32285.1 hypothetical protein GUITHDRAFT_121547 [Guillardia theta CCMP2712]|eukprot:XP_005819265.1 hypothetical protein GUITHDRAFT_121547 [Guillardia theta CCMP2712]